VDESKDKAAEDIDGAKPKGGDVSDYTPPAGVQLMHGDHFKDATRYLTAEARWFVLDSLACMFHNEGYSLQGNTEASDVHWLADCISRRLDHGRRLEQQSSERQAELIHVAQVAMTCLPGLAERIAHRYIGMSKAIRTMEEVSRSQARQMREKKRKERE
jgi:hypothetical protein